MKIINNKYTRFIYNKMLGLTPKKNNKTYGFKFKENPDTKASGYEFFIDKDNLLIRLSDKYKPTKRIHNYLIYYWNNFRDIRCSVKMYWRSGCRPEIPYCCGKSFFLMQMCMELILTPSVKTGVRSQEDTHWRSIR